VVQPEGLAHGCEGALQEHVAADERGRQGVQEKSTHGLSCPAV